jgi:hypothetical protein
MFTQSGSFGFPPYAADPFTCSNAVSVERSIYYNTTSHTNFFCNGTAWTALGGMTSPVAGDFVWTGKQTWGTAAGAANAVAAGAVAGKITFEGATSDAFQTQLGVVDPTAALEFDLPNAAAGTYPILTGANVVTLAQGGTGLTTAADDTVPVSSGAAWVAKTLPACTDTGGNHLNYDQASNAFSCGTSGGATSTFLDGSFNIENTADNTKIAKFDASAITTGTTRTYKLPNLASSTILVGNAAAGNDAFLYFSVNADYGVNWGPANYNYGFTGLRYSNQAQGTLLILTPNTSNSVHIKNSGGAIASGANGPCVSGSACTDPTLAVYSHNNNTTEWISAQHDGTNGLLQVGTGAVAVQPGAGTGRALVGGALNTNATPVGNGADITEDVLITYPLPANSLTVNTRGVEIHAWGTTTNNVDTKMLKCYFGATAIMTQALTVSIAGVWDVRATVLRTGAAGEEAIATLSSQGAAGVAMVTVLDTQPAADTTAAITIKCTGQANAATANDIKQNGQTVEYIN